MNDRQTSQLERMGERIQDEARHLADGAREYARAGSDQALRIGHNTAAFVGENVLPLSLIGLGVGWLVLSMRKQQMGFEDQGPYHGYDYYGLDESSAPRGEPALERARDMTHELVERTRETSHRLVERTREGGHELASRVSDGVGSARARAGELAHEVGHRASALGHEARSQLSDARRSTMDYVDENPLLVSALAVAAGVGVALALPSTRREDQWLGSKRDRLLDEARGLIGDARETTREAVRGVQRQAQETKEELRSAIKEPRFSH